MTQGTRQRRNTRRTIQVKNNLWLKLAGRFCTLTVFCLDQYLDHEAIKATLARPLGDDTPSNHKLPHALRDLRGKLQELAQVIVTVSAGVCGPEPYKNEEAITTVLLKKFADDWPRFTREAASKLREAEKLSFQ